MGACASKKTNKKISSKKGGQSRKSLPRPEIMQSMNDFRKISNAYVINEPTELKEGEKTKRKLNIEFIDDPFINVSEKSVSFWKNEDDESENENDHGSDKGDHKDSSNDEEKTVIKEGKKIEISITQKEIVYEKRTGRKSLIFHFTVNNEKCSSIFNLVHPSEEYSFEILGESNLRGISENIMIKALDTNTRQKKCIEISAFENEDQPEFLNFLEDS